MGVLPDVPALDRVLDYLVPDTMAADIDLGTMVRIPLGPRRVGGWVVALDREPPPGVVLKPIAKVTGHGPGPELLELSSWAAWRWAGRRLTFLRAASPERAVRRLPPRPRSLPTLAVLGDRPDEQLAAAAFAPSAAVSARPGDGVATEISERVAVGPRVVRWPPALDPFPLALAASSLGQALILTPSEASAARLATRLEDAGVWAVHDGPHSWAAAAAGATVVGSRAAAWAPAPALAAVLVLDEHDERFKDERAPAWHARDVVVERAARAGVPAVLASPVPTLDALALDPDGPRCGPRAVERAGWPPLVVIDRRGDDPRSGLYGPAVVEALRTADSAVVVLNRTGRARLLACSRCGELVRCEQCAGAVVQSSAGVLSCPVCATERPSVCAACGTTRLSVLRAGVSRVREELDALTGRTFVEVTAAAAAGSTAVDRGDRCWVGTEAVLHRIGRAELVVFLDIDQELLAPRYRAGEQAFALLARAARIVGARPSGRTVAGRAVAGQAAIPAGRVLVQTRLPDHEVLDAVVHADPGRWSVGEAERRAELQLPPLSRHALLSGPGAPALADALRADPRVLVRASAGSFLVRAVSVDDLADALAEAPLPADRVRIEVDPLRV